MKRFVLCLLIGCGSSQPATQSTDQSTTPSPTAATPTPATTPTSTPATDAPKMGEKCGANDACAEGLECVTYSGIAGPRGPQFKTCEHKCTADADCGTGNRCATIADGPGQVCRPAG